MKNPILQNARTNKIGQVLTCSIHSKPVCYSFRDKNIKIWSWVSCWSRVSFSQSKTYFEWFIFTRRWEYNINNRIHHSVKIVSKFIAVFMVYRGPLMFLSFFFLMVYKRVLIPNEWNHFSFSRNWFTNCFFLMVHSTEM